MNVNEAQYAFFRLNFQRYELLAPNVYMRTWSEADLLGIRKSRFCDEVEIKISKSDFMADFKKTVSRPNKNDPIEFSGRHYGYRHHAVLKHRLIESGDCKPNYFSFLIPEELEDSCDIPDYAGVYVAVQAGTALRIREKKCAPRLHNKKLTERECYELGRKMAYRYWALGKGMLIDKQSEVAA